MEKHPLHLKTPELQKSGEVQDSVAKYERLNDEKLPNDPTDRIEVHMDRLENIFLNPDERVRQRNLEMLRPSIYDAYIIKPEEVPESYFELQQRVARERGQAVEEIPQNVREQMINVLIEDQKHSLDRWIDYLTSNDAVYPTWFKYFVFQNITKLSQFDKTLGKFKKRTADTTAPYPDVFREPLAQICDIYERVAKDNNLLKTDPQIQEEFSKSFPKLYAEKITESLAARLESGEEIKGEWVKYEQGNSEDAERLYKSLQGKGTGWCTAGDSTAKTQIESGDFYVFYSNGKDGVPAQPRLAIRMDGKHKIGEVRGINEHQNVEQIMLPVLKDKLKTFGSEADRYEKKSDDMKKLTEIDNKVKENPEAELSKEDLRFLYEMDSRIDGFGYQKDPRIGEILTRRDIKQDISFVLDIKPEQVSLARSEALSEGIVYHYGNLYLDDIFEINHDEEGLHLPQYIGGSLNLENLTSAKGLKLPQFIRGDLILEGLTSAKDLILPQSIGGYLDLQNLISAEGLTLPNSIGGGINLRFLTSAKGLEFPQSIGGDLILKNLTSAKGVKLPKSVSGSLELDSLIYAEGLTLPQTIGGDLFLMGLTSTKGLTLPKSIGGGLYLNGLTSAKGLTLPQSIGRDLSLKGLTSAEGLTLPQSIGEDLYLNRLTSVEGIKLPQSIGGRFILPGLSLSDIEKLVRQYPQYEAQLPSIS